MKARATPSNPYRFAARLLIILAFLCAAGACTTAKPAKVATSAKKAPIRPDVPAPDIYNDGTHLSNARWKWVTTVQAHDNKRHLLHLDNYFLELKTDGWFNVESPCFKGDGMYEAEDGRIALILLHSHPSKHCLHPESLTFFLKTLEAGSSYREDAERLSLYDKRGNNTLIFMRQGE
ncbi:META domain-containing protein [Candidatus Methylospira mobilis]|uniref:META domain-containing protein n=1 Tax=Candidatus Methylospira mobilis TaxID=1808979 RepID=A0A5Q0BG19_9GAMM|nr:META domain-containing protein [Candidatus Methylospira mobilis]QFY42072.1 META domain-containing protein [Candidatus Methylospira mobilis]WNV03079.1 META domain-containing protein [Candidatus Methylospira mobilis]